MYRLEQTSQHFSCCKSLGLIISDIIYKGEYREGFHIQYYDAILDMINSKYSKGSGKQSASKLQPKVIFPAFFRHKIIQDLGLSRIFRDESLLEALPKNVTLKNPTIVYRLGKTIRGKIFNYRQTLANLDVDDFIANYDNLQCGCDTSKFKDPHHNHIITGDLYIVEQSELRKLMQ